MCRNQEYQLKGILIKKSNMCTHSITLREKVPYGMTRLVCAPLFNCVLCF